ncbi:MAG: cytochrome c maturation protein CcmE [Chromatiales bacterium]|nr:cytochrome c maturation protein CcmE [Chromatiales bacterium]
MTPRQYRMVGVGLVFLGAVVAVTLALRAFQDNWLYFFSPTEVAAGEAPLDRRFRLGGLVTEGSLRREPGEIELLFDVTDGNGTVTVSYIGVLPDLFRENQGVVAIGTLDPLSGMFRADEILARHDENYMSPEVAAALAAQGHALPSKPAQPAGY